MSGNLEEARNSSERQDEQVRAIERLIGHLLRIGVNASLVLIVAGSILSFAEPSGYGAADVQRLTGPEAVFPRTVTWILDGLRRMQGQALIVLGLVVLIGTPVMRVAVSILVFAYQRDRVFVVITSVVLMLLILSFVLGKAAG